MAEDEHACGFHLPRGPRGRADSEAGHPHPSISSVDQEDPSWTGAAHVIGGIRLGCRIGTARSGHRDTTLSGPGGLPAVSAQGIEEFAGR